MKREILLGDEAIGLGAIHAGLSGIYGYPGTPSTEIFEFVERGTVAHGDGRPNDIRQPRAWRREHDVADQGHALQGFAPARHVNVVDVVEFVLFLAAREILLRFDVVRGKGWLGFLLLCFCLALSAFYELLEWWVALLSEEAAEAFLGTQGYVWDTQSDMWYALLGAIAALLLLSRLHDRQLRDLM